MEIYQNPLLGGQKPGTFLPFLGPNPEALQQKPWGPAEEALLPQLPDELGFHQPHAMRSGCSQRALLLPGR